MKREERKAWLRRIRQEGVGKDNYIENRKREAFKQKVTEADKDLDQLLILSEVRDDATGQIRPAQNIAEETRSIRMFATALRLPVVEGETLLQLLGRTYKAWCDAGRLLFNPLSGQFSTEFKPHSKRAKSLANAWHFFEPMSAYNLPPAPDGVVDGQVTQPSEIEQLEKRVNEGADVVGYFSTYKIEL